MPYCSACGSKVESTERFCPNCGQPQGDLAPVSDRLPPIPRGGTGIGRKWIFGVVGLTVLALIVAAVIFLAPPPDIYGEYAVPLVPGSYLVIERDGTWAKYMAAARTADGTWKIEDDEIVIQVFGVEMARYRIEADGLICVLTGVEMERVR